MIGPTYRSLAIQAVLGPDRSELFPATLYGAWLDDELEVLSEIGIAIDATAFGPHEDGVANIETLDGGLCPPETPAFFALMDTAEDGEIVAYAPVAFAETPAEDDPLSCEPGALTFTYSPWAE